MSAILTALAEMVRHVCPESGPDNAAEAARAHEHLSALSQPALREMDALRDKARAADAILAEPASIPPAIVAALYPGQPDARPSVEDVCAEIEGLRSTPTNAAEAVRTIVARLRAKADEVDVGGMQSMAQREADRRCAWCLRDAADRIDRDHAPSAPVERMYSRAQVERLCDDAYAADALDEPGVTFAERVAALLDAPSATAKGER